MMKPPYLTDLKGPLMTRHPDPHALYPIATTHRVCFLKNIITSSQIVVGDYTYYDDPVDVYNFEKNVLYLFDFMQDHLRIGKFCQLATNVRFIMNGSNHSMDGISSYPFKVFGSSWASAEIKMVSKGDTRIGNDVWIGNSVTIMQGISIGGHHWNKCPCHQRRSALHNCRRQSSNAYS